MPLMPRSLKLIKEQNTKIVEALKPKCSAEQEFYAKVLSVYKPAQARIDSVNFWEGEYPKLSKFKQAEAQAKAAKKAEKAERKAKKDAEKAQNDAKDGVDEVKKAGKKAKENHADRASEKGKAMGNPGNVKDMENKTASSVKSAGEKAEVEKVKNERKFKNAPAPFKK